MNDEFFTPETLAAWLGMPRRTIYSWRARGLGPKGHVLGKHLRFRRRDVEEWLAEQGDDRRVG